MSPNEKMMKNLKEARMLQNQINYAKHSNVDRTLCGVPMVVQIAEWETQIEELLA